MSTAVSAPWEKYASNAAPQAPWEKYAQPAAPADQNPNLPGGTPKLSEAVKAGKTPGAQTQPTQFEQERSHPEGFLSHVGQSIKSIIPEPPKTLGEAASAGLKASTGMLAPIIGAGKESIAASERGHGLPYSTVAGLSTLAGVNPERMESAAEKGDTAGVLGEAAVPTAAALAPEALTPIGNVAKEMAPKLANKVLRPVPTKLENAARFGRNPGQAVADEGIIATSHDDMVKKIGEKTSEVGQQIGDSLRGKGTAKTIDARPLIEKPIDDAIQDVIKGKIEGGQAMIDKLEELRNTYASERAMVPNQQGARQLSVTGPKNLKLSPEEAHILKRQIGENTKWSDDSMQQAVNDVKRSMYRNLNEAVQKSVPEVKPLQDRYGNLLEARTSAEREAARHAARNPFGLLDVVSAGAGGAGGLAAGHTTPEALGMALAPVAARHVIQSPLTRTIGVQALQHGPEAVGLSRIGRAAFFLGDHPSPEESTEPNPKLPKIGSTARRIQ